MTATSDHNITQMELANRLSVSTMTIRNWESKKDFEDFIGPFPEGKKEGSKTVYNWKACLQWYVKYMASTQFKSLFSSESVSFEQQKIEGDARKALANAQLAELELQQAQGKLIPASDIEDKLTEAVLTIRQKILTLTPRLSVLLSLSDEQKKAVERESYEILKELADYKNV